MSGIPALRELRSQRAILRPPDRAIPIYQIAGANIRSRTRPPAAAPLRAALTSRSRCSSTVLPPRHPRSPRRCAPLSAAPASRSPAPPCVNACASTTPVSVSPSKLSNSAASSSAAPTAGTCQPDPHRRLPTRSHPATVPLFHRSAPGTHSERNDHLPHSAPSIVQLTSAGGAQRNSQGVSALRHLIPACVASDCRRRRDRRQAHSQRANGLPHARCREPGPGAVLRPRSARHHPNTKPPCRIWPECPRLFGRTAGAP